LSPFEELATLHHDYNHTTSPPPQHHQHLHNHLATNSTAITITTLHHHHHHQHLHNHHLTPSEGRLYHHHLTTPTSPQVCPDPEEVRAVEWVGREQLQEFLRHVEAGGGEVTPWFRLISSHLLPRWWENLGNIEQFKEHSTIHRY